MKYSAKKITTTLLIIVASGTTSAAMYTPSPAPVCAVGAVTTPCESRAWGIGIEGLLVRSNSDFPFVNLDKSVRALGLIAKHDLEIPTKLSWGFRLDGTYQFGQGSDISVNWTHFRGTREQIDTSNTGKLSSRYLANEVEIVLPEITGFFDVPYNFIRVNNDIRFDAVNAEFGQRIIVGERSRFRYHAGLQYAQIRNNLDVFGSSNFQFKNEGVVIVDANVTSLTQLQRRFDGVGPRIGTDLAYEIGGGFSAIGRVAGAILVGKSKSNFNNVTVTNAVGRESGERFPNRTEVSNNISQQSIVPAVEAKLGIKYAYATKLGDLSIEGGWQFAHYHNAIVSPTTILNPQPEGQAPNKWHKDDFAYQGPYLGLKWLANA